MICVGAIRMHDFVNVLALAQNGDSEAILMILKKIEPMLKKNSIVFQQFDEDLYQELVMRAINAILAFK